MTRPLCLFLPLFILGLTLDAQACLWDRDTLVVERRRFPKAHEMITGYFLRHSDAYYQWRIDTTSAKPEADRTPGDYDDIAVSYEKLGDHDKAIEVIQAKIERWPDKGRYESEANLGTFLIHKGAFREGLLHIEKAIAINPNAHFGREIYQKMLVEYIIEKRAEDAEGEELLPLYVDRHGERSANFADYVIAKQRASGMTPDLKPAVKGVLGMMMFGDHDSPALMEVLGDLLSSEKTKRDDAGLLAARAYLRASHGVDSARARKFYREKAHHALQGHHDWSIDKLEPILLVEVGNADALNDKVAEDEAVWVKSGIDVDAAVAKKYRKKR